MTKKKESGELVDILAETLNKNSKSQQVAYFLDSDGNVPTNVPDWVSFGNAILDVAVSNRAYGGAPVGRIIEITGLEQCVTEDTLIDVIIE